MTTGTRTTVDAAADVVIVGGGIIGLATAERLAAHRLSVVVIDEHGVAGGATGASGGLIRAFDPAAGTDGHPWAAEGLSCYLRRGPSGRWPAVREDGSLVLFDADGTERALAGADQVLAAGHTALVLSAPEITAAFPGLTVPEDFVGVYEPRAGWLPAREVAEAMLGDADGVTFLGSARATEVVTSRGRVTGVRTTAGLVSARAVLLAAGVHSTGLARTAGVELPLRTRAVSYCVFTPRGRPGAGPGTGPGAVHGAGPGGPYGLPTVVDSTTGAWLRRWNSGTGVLAGVSSSACDVPPTVTAGVPIAEQRRIREVVRHRRPPLADADATGGVTAYDVLGPGGKGAVTVWPEPYGLVTATGWNGGGFKLAPAVGRHTAARIREVIA
ncbi:NAD(P)/FAD-dependent oxidoreductase [Kitasatospora sp. NPDC092286]|uniref:NAD(P)/FAD-dependent oxidoreductase n=1 Tax=Kitasatospora sp. NPDC092286 TaxID=3364087 RepID=UPI00380D2D12